MSEEVLAANPIYKTEILDRYPDHEKRHKAELAKWETEKAELEKEGKQIKRGRPWAPWRPAELYNGMIAPLIPCAIRGAIWYQGESNAGNAWQYRTLFPDMISNWRTDFGQGEDRKSTRLNSSHGYISYAVFCLKKKKGKNRNTARRGSSRSGSRRSRCTSAAPSARRRRRARVVRACARPPRSSVGAPSTSHPRR